MSIQSSSSSRAPLPYSALPPQPQDTDQAARAEEPQITSLDTSPQGYGDLCVVADEDDTVLTPPPIKKARTPDATSDELSDEESALIRSIEKQSSSVRPTSSPSPKIPATPAQAPTPIPVISSTEPPAAAAPIPGLANVTPVKNYPIQVCDDGRIRIILTPKGKESLKAAPSVVYRFKRTTTEQRYIGATQNPQGRVRSHQYAMNNPEKVLTALSQEISDTPDDFVFGVILELPKDRDARTEETTLIKYHKATEPSHGYNRREGGGGGVAQKKKTGQDGPTMDQKKLVKKISEGYASPEGRPLTKGEKITVTLPSKDRTSKSVIYDILYTPTENKTDRIHHIGYTTTTLGQRLSSHMSMVNNPQGKAAQRAGNKLTDLYEAIRKDPDHYSIRIYDVSTLVNEGTGLPDLETAYMEFFQKERKETVQNYGCGGRGSVAQARK